MHPDIREVSLEQLQLINNESGPGEERDSSFISKLMSLFWSDDELVNKSVTGRRMNAHKEKTVKPALEENKLNFIYGNAKSYSKLSNYSK